MLNFKNQELTKIITGTLSAKAAREAIIQAYNSRMRLLRNDPLWQGNLPALQAETLSYTALMADKLLETLKASKDIDPAFAERLWFEPAVGDGDHSTIKVYLASPDQNTELLAIEGILTDSGRLVAKNLPTLLQITAKEPDLPYTAAEVHALAAMIKVLYTADLTFATIDETVLQPVDGLSFATKFDSSKPLSTTVEIKSSGNIKLAVPLDHGSVVDYQVVDDNGHDWKELGADSTDNDVLTWASTTIPGELVGAHLRLQVNVRTAENSPALDELFVIASSNAILMRQAGRNAYALDLPNHNVLGIKLDTANNRIILHYPEKTVHVMELDHLYPFLGQWLKAVLPQRRAFN
ncbi:hypothetical protein ACFQ3L_02915 [Lacticaseibacillus jixianensis]|uniref:Uncharacterized protein n=1 Tax=Lacticaseibacillus jixianensis TaxID=2486012 RepID=A0ABW4B684_9LACO|nr:hypothetical protein [Lacticaseibacillus jixianensis]